jgi:hypothetical protein
LADGGTVAENGKAQTGGVKKARRVETVCGFESGTLKINVQFPNLRDMTAFGNNIWT